MFLDNDVHIIFLSLMNVPSGKQSYSNGISTSLRGNTSSKGPFSIAILAYRRVCKYPFLKHDGFSCHVGLRTKFQVRFVFGYFLLCTMGNHHLGEYVLLFPNI